MPAVYTSLTQLIISYDDFQPKFFLHTPNIKEFINKYCDA
jgi:hypothetical protein